MEPKEIKTLHERSLLIGAIIIGKEKGDLSKIRPPITQMEWRIVTDYVMKNQKDNTENSDLKNNNLQEIRMAQELKLYLGKANRIEELRIMKKINKQE